jgi:hypothetical protein
MKPLRHLLLSLALLGAAMPSAASDLRCSGPANVEEFRYAWRLRGGVRFLAGLVFPTSGVGNLRTTYATATDHSIHSELLITAPEGKSGGFYEYQSQMDAQGSKTLMTYHGYEWGNKSRNERTIFDYTKGLARIHKETTEETENRVKKLPDSDGTFRDILTAIHYLRQHALTIKGPVATSIYSDGREYPVTFRPFERRTFVIDGKTTAARGFEIVDAPGGRKWPGGVKVWLSDDERRIPFRIEIQQSVASLQLDLQSVDACAFLVGG